MVSKVRWRFIQKRKKLEKENRTMIRFIAQVASPSTKHTMEEYCVNVDHGRDKSRGFLCLFRFGYLNQLRIVM